MRRRRRGFLYMSNRLLKKNMIWYDRAPRLAASAFAFPSRFLFEKVCFFLCKLKSSTHPSTHEQKRRWTSLLYSLHTRPYNLVTGEG
jgi:hypothetical protein